MKYRAAQSFFKIPSASIFKAVKRRMKNLQPSNVDEHFLNPQKFLDLNLAIGNIKREETDN